MKKFFKVTLLATVLMIACGSSAYAQKFGFIDTGELISVMPEMEKVRGNLEAFNKEMQELYETMTVEFNNKAEAYTKSMNDLSEAVRKIKEDELQKLRERIEQFQETAPESMQEEQSKLMKPVVDKARDAIQKVGKANGFTAVFDLASSALAYHDDNSMVNILEMVKKEMGIN